MTQSIVSFVIFALFVFGTETKSSNHEIHNSRILLKTNEGRVNKLEVASSCTNPFMLGCLSDIQCKDEQHRRCYQQNPDDSSTWFCDCNCGYEPCKTDRDCCNNQCVNGTCTQSGGIQSTVCGDICSSCASGYVCQTLPDAFYGYCNKSVRDDISVGHRSAKAGSEFEKHWKVSTASPLCSNPYILGCTSDTQCRDTLSNRCNRQNPDDSSTWACACVCNGKGPCGLNRDCCNNRCDNGTCSQNGGHQGTWCDTASDCTFCADRLSCQTVSFNATFGYCDRDANPYILACNSSKQCENRGISDECIKGLSGDPNTWFCECYCDSNGPCKANNDCCNNECYNGVCTTAGGLQGAYCNTFGACAKCADGYACRSWPDDLYGFCDYTG